MRGRDLAGEDERLAALAAAGDRAAMSELLERHYPTVLRVARNACGNGAMAEDAAQEACVRLATRIGSYAARSSFRTWLHSIAANAARDHLRRERAGERNLRRAFSDPTYSEGPGEDACAWLEEALGSLDHDLRVTASLVVGEGMTHGEAGAALGVAEGTVSWRMKRVRDSLRAAGRA